MIWGRYIGSFCVEVMSFQVCCLFGNWEKLVGVFGRACPEPFWRHMSGIEARKWPIG